MNRIAATALLTLLALPAFASDHGPVAMGTQLGKTESEVRASLAGMGYEVRKIETEDGMIEAYYVGDKVKGEVYVSTATGEVAKIGE